MYCLVIKVGKEGKRWMIYKGFSQFLFYYFFIETNLWGKGSVFYEVKGLKWGNLNLWESSVLSVRN